MRAPPSVRPRIPAILLLVFGAALLLAGCGRKARVSAPAVSHPPPAAVPIPAGPQPAPAPLPEALPRETRPAPPPQTPEPLSNPPIPGRSGPPIRIALNTSLQEVRISAPGEFYLVEKIPEGPKKIVSGEVQVRVENEIEETSEVYRIQIAALSHRETAEQLQRTLAEKFSLPAVTRASESSGTTQVRLGEFPTREEAERFAAGPLLEAGYRESFVVREATTTGGGERRLALRGPGQLFRVSRAGYLFYPVSEAQYLRVNGKPYRGILDLNLNKKGRINLINQLGLEEYLYGVLPAELPPNIYPQAAALEAQAVAARTYALKNMGRNRSEGFDLTADERTQVYAGVSLEHNAANQAVRSTEGLALYYQDVLIEAMYSSTCGGKTEDFANVFEASAVPYLTSVTCASEISSAGREAVFRGSLDLPDPIFADDGTLANRYLELARILRIVQTRKLSPEYLSDPPSEEEARQWIETAALLVKKHRQDGGSRTEDVRSRAGFLKYAAEQFFGAQEISQRISSSDAAYYLGNLKDGERVPSSARTAFAFLIQKGLWRPYPNSTARPSMSISRSDALSLLSRWVEAIQGDILKAGIFHDLTGTSASIRRGSRTEDLLLAEDVRLFRIAGGRSLPVDTLRLIGGEKLSFHLGPDGEIDFLEVELNPAGTTSDRFSPQAIWQTTLARGVVSEKLRPLIGGIGEVKDLIPARLGASGRAVQIRVEGTRGSVVLNGFKVRGVLGLKDTLFVISRKHNSDGSIGSFIFDGRGWGHGVGLCQVGAFGMAQTGRSFEEILKTYYRGVELRTAY